MINISAKPEFRKIENLPETIIKSVKNRISHNTFHALYFSDGSTKLVPDAKFGNAVYGARQKVRAMAYQAKLSPMLKIDSGSFTSNAIFATLTVAYEKNNPKSTREAVKAVKKQFPKFIRSLRKGGLIAHLEGFECHRHGGFHAHVVLVLDHSLRFFRDRKGKARHGALNTLIREAWAIGNADVQGVMSEAAAGYVLKELAKSYSCEKALKRVEAGEALEKNDANRIWLTWVVDKTGCRTFGHSENLAISEEDLEAAKEAIASRLDSKKTNSTDLPPTLIATLEFSPFQVHKLDWFIPWTGKVDPGSRMYRELWALCPATPTALAQVACGVAS